MREKELEKLAETIRSMVPGQEITVRNKKERMALWGIVRSFRLGSVIDFRIITSANRDGSYTAIAIKDRR